MENCGLIWKRFYNLGSMVLLIKYESKYQRMSPNFITTLNFRSVIHLIENTTEQKIALKNGSADILLTPVVPTIQDLQDFNQTIPIDTIM